MICRRKPRTRPIQNRRYSLPWSTGCAMPDATDKSTCGCSGIPSQLVGLGRKTSRKRLTRRRKMLPQGPLDRSASRYVKHARINKAHHWRPRRG
jgi:hypothetical protein